MVDESAGLCPGLYSDGEIQGIFALKIDSCLQCDMFHTVAEEEGDSFLMHLEENRSVEEIDNFLM